MYIYVYKKRKEKKRKEKKKCENIEHKKKTGKMNSVVLTRRKSIGQKNKKCENQFSIVKNFEIIF